MINLLMYDIQIELKNKNRSDIREKIFIILNNDACIKFWSYDGITPFKFSLTNTKDNCFLVRNYAYYNYIKNNKNKIDLTFFRNFFPSMTLKYSSPLYNFKTEAFIEISETDHMMLLMSAN